MATTFVGFFRKEKGLDFLKNCGRRFEGIFKGNRKIKWDKVFKNGPSKIF